MEIFGKVSRFFPHAAPGADIASLVIGKSRRDSDRALSFLLCRRASLLIVAGRTASGRIVGQRNAALNYRREDFALRSRKNKRLPLTRACSRALLQAEEDLIVGHRRGMVT